MFDRTEWLSNIHIQDFFLRLFLKQRSKIQQESDDATDADDHLIEASASDVDEKCLREARNTVMDDSSGHNHFWISVSSFVIG